MDILLASFFCSFAISMGVRIAKIINQEIQENMHFKVPEWGFRGGQDYYPFGMIEPGRQYAILGDSAYRFGFNGKLHDDNIYGKNNSYDYGMRFFDPRVADFLSIDPLESKYPYYSSFQFAGRNPIEASDLDGKEPDYINSRIVTLVSPEFDNNNISRLPSNLEQEIPDNPTGSSGTNKIVNYHTYTVSSEKLKSNIQNFSNNWINDNIDITSGDRTPAKNKLVGGANDSRHLHHDAADMKVNKMNNKTLANAAHKSGLFNTVIYYPKIDAKSALHPHVHVDLNPAHNNNLLKYTPVIKNNKVIKNSYTKVNEIN